MSNINLEPETEVAYDIAKHGGGILTFILKTKHMVLKFLMLQTLLKFSQLPLFQKFRHILRE